MTYTVAVARRVFYLVTVLRWAPIGLLIPVLVLVMTERGLSLTGVALVTVVSGVTVAVLELPTGGFADAFGRRPVLIASSVIHGAGLVVFLLAEVPLAFALSWLLIGAARALGSGPLEAWYIDAALEREPDRDIEADLSGHGVAEGAALGGGAIVAGLLGLVGHVELGRLALTPIEIPLVAAVVVQVLHLGAVVTLVREAAPPRGLPALRRAVRRTPAVIRTGAALGWRDVGIRAVLGTEFAWGIAISTVEFLWQPRVQQLVGDVSERTVLLGIFGAGAFLAGAVGAALLPALRRAVGGRTGLAATIATLVQAVAIAGMAAVGGAPLLLGVYLVAYVGNGACSPAHMSLLHRRVASGQRATIVSVNSLGGQAGGILGHLALLPLADVVGIPAVWAVAAVVMLASAPLYLVADRSPPLGPVVTRSPVRRRDELDGR